MQAKSTLARDVELVDALVLASRSLVAVAARSLAHVDDDVTLPQYRVLVVTNSRGPQSLASLAEALRVSPATATRMCDRLVRKRLIKRSHDARDRRSVRIELTARGRDVVTRVLEERRHEIQSILDEITVPQRRLVIDALLAFAVATGDQLEHDWSVGWDL
ncbi:MAG: MarR family transcriptional regulator [Acidobacteriota bacterium]|nr:MarR family transcriptional regulator [Acidobacteriota bacterium]MDE3223579.1 MarR family transcriptional regulator [Acidobacteriota bacterium]